MEPPVAKPATARSPATNTSDNFPLIALASLVAVAVLLAAAPDAEELAAACSFVSSVVALKHGI